MRSALIIVLLLAGCPPTPTPDPKPQPEPTPVTTPCERACKRMDELHCAAATSDCPVTCERFSEEGGALDWHPTCIETAADCKAAEKCRGN